MQIIEDPIPPHVCVAHLPEMFIAPAVIRSAAWRRLRREHPGLTDILTDLFAAAHLSPGYGLEDDSDTLAFHAGIAPDEWMADWDALVRSHMVRGESGLLYVRLLLPSAVASVTLHLKHKRRTQPGRDKLAELREAQEAAPPKPKKPKPKKDLPPDEAEVATKPSMTGPSPVYPDSLPPEPTPQEAEVECGEPVPGGAEAPTGEAGIADRIIALYPCWPSYKPARRAMEVEARRQLRELIERDPEAAGGRAILAAINRQSGWFRRKRRPDENAPPHIGCWLEKGRWRAKPQGAKGKPAGAPQPAKPGPQASDEERLAYAVQLIETMVASGKGRAAALSLVRNMDHYWPNAPQLTRERLSDRLRERVEGGT